MPITFTVTAINGGTSPGYQWKVNGINEGTNSPFFTYVPGANCQVSCILTSSEPCTTSNPATSNEVSITVVESPKVTFTPCFDTITTINAKPIRLRGGIPLGGIYSGPGVTGSTGGTGWTFDPALAGAGIHVITYNYINEAGCQGSSKISVFNFQFSIATTASPISATAKNILPF
ncbi:MAG: hypothetical protein JXA23_09465 [Bacteroidales bacterium]|nr:hypothetical protein [Bacteroidales bacterium]